MKIFVLGLVGVLLFGGEVEATACQDLRTIAHEIVDLSSQINNLLSKNGGSEIIRPYSKEYKPAIKVKYDALNKKKDAVIKRQESLNAKCDEENNQPTPTSTPTQTSTPTRSLPDSNNNQPSRSIPNVNAAASFVDKKVGEVTGGFSDILSGSGIGNIGNLIQEPASMISNAEGLIKDGAEDAMKNALGGIGSLTGGISKVSEMTESLSGVLGGGSGGGLGGGGTSGGGGSGGAAAGGPATMQYNGPRQTSDAKYGYSTTPEQSVPIPTGDFEIIAYADKFGAIGTNTSLREYILMVTNFVLTFLGIVCVVVLIYAGFMYATALGDDTRTEEAKKILIYVVVGILLVLGAFAIVNTTIEAGGGYKGGGSVSEADQRLARGFTVDPNSAKEGIDFVDRELGLWVSEKFIGKILKMRVGNSETIEVTMDGHKTTGQDGVIEITVPSTLKSGQRVEMQVKVKSTDDVVNNFTKMLYVGGIHVGIFIGVKDQFDIFLIPNEEIKKGQEFVFKSSVRISPNPGFRSLIGQNTSNKWTCKDNCIGFPRQSNDKAITARFANTGRSEIILEVTTGAGMIVEVKRAVKILGAGRDAPPVGLAPKRNQNVKQAASSPAAPTPTQTPSSEGTCASMGGECIRPDDYGDDECPNGELDGTGCESYMGEVCCQK